MIDNINPYELADQLCHSYYYTGYEQGKKDMCEKILKAIKDNLFMVSYKETDTPVKIAQDITEQCKETAIMIVEKNL